jgi:superfamily II DNA or RNA helicase
MKCFSQELLILTSPPASGKTYWIESFAEEVTEKILVISPLRALADECRGKWNDKILTMTPEEWLLKKVPASLVIFDEFHLHFYWGDNFRNAMWECFYELTYGAHFTVLLTATLSQEMVRECEQFKTHFDEMTWINCGNQQLKYIPYRYIKMPDARSIEQAIFHYGVEGVKLIFCEYREQVFEWERKLTKKGFRVWTCVGGEAQKMHQHLAHDPEPDYIVATTVLSHGVNLPRIACVYFLYRLDNIDFWIQMVARGGRRGEKYEVFSLENPHGIIWSRWSNTLALLRVRIKMWKNTFFEDLDQCFLKESSSTKSLTKKGISS